MSHPASRIEKLARHDCRNACGNITLLFHTRKDDAAHEYTLCQEENHNRQHERNQVGANTGLSPLIARYKTIHDGWWFGQVQLIADLVGQGAKPFEGVLLQLRRTELMKLSFSAWQCRRRVRDKIFFFFICWFTALIGNKAQ